MTSQAETILAAPPVTVVGISAFGISLPDIAWIVTILYTSVLLGHKVWRIYREIAERREAKFGRRADDESDE